MNPYLSRDEKENFIRATALASMIEDIINDYAGTKSADPDFLKYLRMGRTMISKALKMRADALDPEAKTEFHRQVSKLELIFVPTLEAKKHYAEIAAMRSTLPMELQDFEDWYCAVIETTCKTCLKTDYTECQIRRVLAKYGVYPIDPGATNKCQYCYVGTINADKPEEETAADTVPVEKYNLAVAEYEAVSGKVEDLLLKISNEYLPKIAELQQKIEQLESMPAPAAPDPAQSEEEKEKGELIPVTLGLTSGNTLALHLPEYMATHLLEEIRKSNRSFRPISACHVGEELVVVDMQDVVTVQAKGLPPITGLRPPQPFTPRPAREYEADTGERERYRVECECGAEYFCSMNVGRDYARCRDCKKKVYADRSADRIPDPMDGTEATLLTNRYRVERDEDPGHRPATQEYMDPCDPFRKGA